MALSHLVRKLTLLLGLAGAAAPAAASAQAHVSIRVGLPAIVALAAPPPLAVMEPGVKVVQDVGAEVFFVDGCYWTRHAGAWFRARDRHARWVLVEPRRVPVALVRIPPGHHRQWHRGRLREDWRAPARRWPQLDGPMYYDEWNGSGWRGARAHGSWPERRWTKARWSPPVRERRGRGHR
jgi:hypothetical protein